MQLLSFQKNKKKKQSVILLSIGLVLLVAGIILYQTYSLFEESGEYDVIRGSVPEYIDNYDIKVNFKLDGVNINKVPDRNSGKGIESIFCDKGAIGVWDYIQWNFNVKSLSQTKTTCTVNFISRYIEDNLHGTDPVIQDELIPVTIESNGTVHKANIQEKWYDYNNKEWANAVILKDKNIMYQNGEVIPEDNIESYFVWIPRYKYKLFDMGEYEGLTSIENKPQIIEVEFGVDTTVDSDSSCKTPMGSGASGNCSVGKYMTHPAFLSFQSIGMWVGKFETGYKDAKTKEAAEKNVNEPSSIQIKPNVYSWRGIQVSNAYLSSYNYKREYNSHMMKNTEWGAVAYLQHSKYGSQASVRINNNESFLTGYASVFEPSCGYTGPNEECNRYESTLPKVDGTYTVNYLNSASVYASTTNNYSGVYDMSGGAWESVMGVMKFSDNQTPCSGKDAIYNSGFNGPYCNAEQTGSLTSGVPFPEDQRYYNVYAYAETDNRYDRRILGDATGEMGPFVKKTYANNYGRQIGSWYEDEAWFIFSDGPWFCRGRFHNVGAGAGAFAFGQTQGSVDLSISFRIVLTV